MKPNQYIRFKRSKPWGYLPSEVEKAIDEYEATIGKLNARLMELNQIAIRYKERCAQLEDELRAMHIEMSALELPDTEEIVESVVLNDFRNYPGGHPNPVASSPMPQEEGVVGIPAGENQHGEGLDMIGHYEEDDAMRILSGQDGEDDPAPQAFDRRLHLNQSEPKQDDDDNDGFFIVS